MTDEHRSIFAIPFPEMPEINGVRLASGATGIRYKNRDDIFYAELAFGTQVGGVLTKNVVKGAPVVWNRANLHRGKAKALVVNAGISNVSTGEAGMQTVWAVAAKAGELESCHKEDIYIASTGIIGEPLPAAPLVNILPSLKEKLTPQAWKEAACAMMTTDTFAKGVTKTCKIGDAVITLNGIVKGSGMIAPNMATMLGFIFTDAKIEAPVLQGLLDYLTPHTFNAVTVDGDTSTSDMVLLFATQKAQHETIRSITDFRLNEFKKALHEMMAELAQAVVKDGEGVRKFVTVRVTGAGTTESARNIGLTIANSLLVKTAIAGEDPNWGRILAAAGRSGEEMEIDRCALWIGTEQVVKFGKKLEGYVEANAKEYMKQSEILIHLDLGLANGESKVWTTDLTERYIQINADYRS